MKIALPRPAPPFNVMAVVTPLVIELRPRHGRTLLEIRNHPQEDIVCFALSFALADSIADSGVAAMTSSFTPA